ncbi:uncharacterized protein LOC128882926 [Hylaeus volcanicus]|uniref:uncharacterized protein LOC128882926 n=1 Tax=Hylaeus volcanicus TaxID=313075 RepID=UPI0023B7B59E|nr:uncharacterized protein LOC128882926 [Hylaeus volcanicus]
MNSLPLENFANIQYFGLVQIGHPPQLLRIMFDTGSSHTWVSAPDCNENQTKCSTTTSFNKTASTTFKFIEPRVNISVTYGKGTVSGILAQDNMSIGRLMLGVQQFILVNQEQNLQGVRFDGVIGLGISQDSRYNSSVFSKLIEVNKGEAVKFAFHLSKNPKSISEIIFYTNKIYFDQIKGFAWTSVVNKTPYAWTFKAFVSLVNNERKKHKTHNLNSHAYMNLFIFGIVDSGTSFIAIPENHYTEIISALIPTDLQRFCWVDPITKLLQCPCSTYSYFNSLELKIPSTIFSRNQLFHKRNSKLSFYKIIFSPEDYVTRISGNSITHYNTTLEKSRSKNTAFKNLDFLNAVCQINIRSGPNELPWIFGDIFLQKVNVFFVSKPSHSIIGFRLKTDEFSPYNEVNDNDNFLNLLSTTSSQIVHIPINATDDNLIKQLYKKFTDFYQTNFFVVYCVRLILLVYITFILLVIFYLYNTSKFNTLTTRLKKKNLTENTMQDTSQYYLLQE